MRSKLFVPGSRPELFPKALASEADALCFDLEDAVDESRKAEARAVVADFIGQAASCSKRLIVRTNALNSPHFEADTDAIVRPGLDLLNLPKVEDAKDVHAAVAAVERAESRRGMAPSVRLLLNIETPRGLRLAVELASASPRVAGLQVGYGDLFEPLQITRRDPASVHATMYAVRIAAGAAGVFAFDGAFADVQDAHGYRAEADMARRLGFLGKSCIHPSQIALANAVFRPSDDEIAHARRVVEVAKGAAARGVAAFVVDGKMIDGPFLRHAKEIVATAERLGLV